MVISAHQLKNLAVLIQRKCPLPNSSNLYLNDLLYNFLNVTSNITSTLPNYYRTSHATKKGVIQTLDSVISLIFLKNKRYHKLLDLNINTKPQNSPESKNYRLTELMVSMLLLISTLQIQIWISIEMSNLLSNTYHQIVNNQINHSLLLRMIIL